MDRKPKKKNAKRRSKQRKKNERRKKENDVVREVIIEYWDCYGIYHEKNVITSASNVSFDAENDR